MSLVQNIKNLSDAQGISLKDLGLKLEIGENAVYKWEKSSPKVDTLQKVADYFQVSLDSLVGRSMTEEKYREEKPKDAYILLGEKARDKGMPLEVLEKLIEFYTK